jgi:hypothetical protein
MRKFLKYLIAFLIIPFAFGLSKMFYSELSRAAYLNMEIISFLLGILIYMTAHVFGFKPSFIYVIGHELVHVLATVLCGGKVTAFNASAKGGSVKTSKTNFFIELSPYFVPLYTLILIFLIPVVRYNLTRSHLFHVYIMFIGFTLGLHLIMNADAMKVRQPDITKSGYFFSLLFIYIANLLAIFFIFTFFAKQISFKEYFIRSLEYTKDLYVRLWHKFVMR